MLAIVFAFLVYLIRTKNDKLKLVLKNIIWLFIRGNRHSRLSHSGPLPSKSGKNRKWSRHGDCQWWSWRVREFIKLKKKRQVQNQTILSVVPDACTINYTVTYCTCYAVPCLHPVEDCVLIISLELQTINQSMWKYL